MKMKHWRARLMSRQKDKYVVKVSQLKVESGIFGANNNKDNNLAIQVRGITVTNKGKGSSTNWKHLVPFRGIITTPKGGYTHTTSPLRLLTFEASTIVWDAGDLCGFELALTDGYINGACHIDFHLLHGEGDAEENKAKMVVIGKVSMSVTMEELLVRDEMNTESNFRNVQRTLPFQLNVHGLCMEATLSVSFSTFQLRNFHDDLPRSVKKQRFIEMVKSLTSLVKKKTKLKLDQAKQPSSPYYESYDSTEFDSDDSSIESTTSSTGSSSTANSVTNGYGSIVGSDRSMLSWNRSFKEWWTSKTALTSHLYPSMISDKVSPQLWEDVELWSRDGQAKLKTNVSFASFDQRSKQASGESACSALVLFISHWLHSNKEMPTKSQFNNLIMQGSSQWRRLCKIDPYLKRFPDKHFDLETVLGANLRPLIVVPQKSYTGFFSPEKFHCLKGAMSFDEIWDEMVNRNNVVDDIETRIYIISWKDHFFVLKMEADAYYIIDTLGERLFKGCQKAFVLKFDGSSLMHATREDKAEKERLDNVCSGKECCKEFIKRFLAAMTVRQLEEEEEEENKGDVSNPYYLHRLLQVDIHYSSLSSL